jgi:hypothetical protein
MPEAAVQREVCKKVAQWLVARDRRQEAVSILCVGAVSGANDTEGQELLAEALRLQPDSPIAKGAFARMQGVPGDDTALAAALAQFDVAAIEKLDKERTRPQFMRAQVGFNNNVKYQGKPFHVQTEDSGLKMPHIITHLFADGGRIIKSHKRSYADHVSRDDVPSFVRGLMKSQHMEMVLALREGKFDEIIAGRARGGMDLLTEPPQVDMQAIGTKKQGDHGEKIERTPSIAPPPPHAPEPVEQPPTSKEPIHFRLRVTRSLSQQMPELYEPRGDAVVIGASGAVKLEGEKYCHPSEGIFTWRDGELYLEDLEGGNGLFVRVRRPVELDFSDEFVVGDQLLRIEKNPEADNGPDTSPTYMWFSPHPPTSSFRIVQVLAGGAIGSVKVAGGTTLQIGRNEGDMTFPRDPFVGERHCFVEEQAGVLVLTDLQTQWGVFVRIRGEQKLENGDELLVGRTRLRVEI